MKERSYEGLVAGMRERPTIFDAEEVLRKDYKVKFPDRRAITMWNTPEISQFRGVQEEMDEEEERRYNAQVEHLEIRREGRQNETATPEMDSPRAPAEQAVPGRPPRGHGRTERST